MLVRPARDIRCVSCRSHVRRVPVKFNRDSGTRQVTFTTDTHTKRRTHSHFIPNPIPTRPIPPAVKLTPTMIKSRLHLDVPGVATPSYPLSPDEPGAWSSPRPDNACMSSVPPTALGSLAAAKHCKSFDTIMADEVRSERKSSLLGQDGSIYRETEHRSDRQSPRVGVPQLDHLF